jgi:hypothetical protein
VAADAHRGLVPVREVGVALLLRERERRGEGNERGEEESMHSFRSGELRAIL